MPSSYRIVKARYASDAFSGEGARLYGGRWNSVGTRMVYTSGSISLCTLEMLVHLHDPRILSGYVLLQVDMRDAMIASLSRARLPRNWRTFPAPQELAAIGDEWIRSRRSVAMEVPSSVIEAESNYLLNPAHPDFASLVIHSPIPHDFDGRLVTP